MSAKCPTKQCWASGADPKPIPKPAQPTVLSWFVPAKRAQTTTEQELRGGVVGGGFYGQVTMMPRVSVRSTVVSAWSNTHSALAVSGGPAIPDEVV